MTDDSVALTNVTGELFELGTVKGPYRKPCLKTFVESNALKLTQLLLVEGADAQVADELTGPASLCPFWF